MAKERRGGGRSRRVAQVASEESTAPAYIKRKIPYYEVLDDTSLSVIENNAEIILEEIGIEFLHPEAVAILKQSGCTVKGTNVRMGRDFVMEMVGKAPSSFTLTPRNPDRQITIGGNHINFGNVSSPPNYWDMSIGTKIRDDGGLSELRKARLHV